MFSKKEIIKELGKNDIFIDKFQLNKYLKELNIDAIYENEECEEFFDNTAIEKIEEKFSSQSNSIIDVQSSAPVPQNFEGAELQKFTIDITNQTLSVLADSIAQKITHDVAQQVQKSDVINKAINNGSLRRDNEILAKQIKKLIEENKELSQKLKTAEQETSKFHQIVGNVYVKSL